jgi:dTDP-4-amino-4,6-dideoxygalactose transaminase
MNNFKWPSWPNYTKKDIDAVSRVVKSNQIFSAGEVKKFENQFAKFNKSKFVKAVGNATQGLHLALSALEIGFGDEVIVTNYSWISTASCILMQNAKPVFVDIELDTLGADPKKIEKAITKKTKAIIIVHMFGNPCKIREIKQIANKYKIKLIEDASHAHGSTFNKKKIGNFSDIAVFSCHQRKNLSAGEGGLIISKNKSLDNRIYKLRSFGDQKLSYNYRMTEFCAVLGQNSLKKLNSENIYRNTNINFLSRKFEFGEYFKIIMPLNNCKSTFYKLPLLYEYKKFKKNINFFIKYMNKLEIPFSHAYTPLSHHSNFNINKKKNKSFPNIDLNYKKQRNFKNTFDICYNKLTELSIHRPVGKYHLNYLIKNLKIYINKYGLK